MLVSVQWTPTFAVADWCALHLKRFSMLPENHPNKRKKLSIRDVLMAVTGLCVSLACIKLIASGSIDHGPALHIVLIIGLLVFGGSVGSIVGGCTDVGAAQGCLIGAILMLCSPCILALLISSFKQ